MPPLDSSIIALDVCNNRGIIHHLSQQITVEGVRRLPFPNLRELRLDSATALEPQDILALVESRLQ